MRSRLSFLKINPRVFWTANIVIAGLVLLSFFAQSFTQKVFVYAQNWVLTEASWLYVLSVAIILMTVIFLAVSRYGDIKLGPDHSTPDYRTSTWFAMLFSTGMGIGLLFFGVAEPIMHFSAPPVGEGGTINAAREAMKLTFFHWGLHAWAIYAIVGLILAFFSFRHQLPLSLRSALYPLIKQRIYGPIGDMVDVFAVFGTVFGLATSLGYGVLQINSGLNYLFAVPVANWVQVVLIICAVALATLSVTTGLDKGIKILSELNLVLALVLLLVVLIVGPTGFILQTFLQNTGTYVSDIVAKTFNLYAYEPKGSGASWVGGWTILYWGWWLSWSPFVGLFIARISRGRTIREFVLGVLLIPTAFTLFWMSVFGDTAIHMVLYQGHQALVDVTTQDSSLALFKFFELLPFSFWLSLLALFMVIVFFVTSADSGALVVDMLASGGELNTPAVQRAYWSILIGAVAIALLQADGLKALQAVTIVSALPFALILLVAIWGLFKALRVDLTKQSLRSHAMSRAVSMTRDKEAWQGRIRHLMSFPRRAHVDRYIAEVVLPAFEQVAIEWKKQGSEVDSLANSDGSATITVSHGNEVDFLYEIKPVALLKPSFSMHSQLDQENNDTQKYFRAEVFLREGGQDYDVMGWSKEDVITDVIDQYERHLYFLHRLR